MLDVALRGLELLDEEGLVSVSGSGVVVVCVRDGRAGRAEGRADEMQRLCRAAWLRAGQSRAWPVPTLPPATVGEVDRGGPIREAIATSWGTRTYETRAEPVELLATRAVRLSDGRVLGEEAVSSLLAALAPVFGVEVALGEPPPTMHPAVTLIDDHADTHSFDANGTRRQQVVVVVRGRFVNGVSAETGHATRPLTLAPLASHLRFEGEDEVGPPDVETLGPLRSKDARALLSQVVACSAA